MIDLDNLKLSALEESKKSVCHFQHATLIIYKGTIVASGHNDDKHHSEENAIIYLRRLLCGKQRY